jgi:hypothetical protein
MRKLAWVVGAIAAFALWLASANAHQPFRFSDDFSKYPAGSIGEPNWEVTDIGFEIRNGTMHAEVVAGRCYAILKLRRWDEASPLKRR